MHQRTSCSRSRPPRKEKIYRNSKDDSERVKPVSLFGSSSSSSTGEQLKSAAVSSSAGRHPLTNKSRSRSRDGVVSEHYHSRGMGKGDREDREYNFSRKRQDSSPSESRKGEGGPYGHSSSSHHTRPNANNAHLSSTSSSSSSRDMKEKRSEYSHGFTDDTRLSKLMHRVLRDEDTERRMSTCKQLKEFLLQMENWKSASKNADKLLTVLEEILQDKISSDVKTQIASVMGLIGYIATAEIGGFRYFEWIFDKYRSTTNDEVRIFLLNALVETLKNDQNKHKLDNMMPTLMSNIQSVLENADVPELLTAIVEVILQISNKHPQAFEAHFRDTVDILVGWHIDTTQTEALTQFTSDALVSFNAYWVEDINFSVTLLGQFLEDMEAYSEELNSGGSPTQSTDDEQPSLMGCAAKITSLIKVYTTVVRSLGESFQPDKTGAITHEFLLENASRLVKSVTAAGAVLPMEGMLIAANECIGLLLTYLKTYSASLTKHLVACVDQQICINQPISSALLSSVLTLLITAVKEIHNELPFDCAEKILGPDALLPKFRFTSSLQVQQQYLILYRAIFSLKNVPLLDEAYKYVVGDMHAAFNKLLGWNLDLPAMGPPVATEAEAEAVIIFSLCSIAEIGNAKNSILSMWALSPSIFDLLSCCLCLTDPDLARRYPTIHYAVIFSLYSHCSRYGNFILSSCLLNVAPPKPRSSSFANSMSPATNGHAPDSMITGGHFESILKILADVLLIGGSSFDTKMLCLKWSLEVVESAQPFLQTIGNVDCVVSFVLAIVTSAFGPDKQISLAACTCLQHLVTKLSSLKASVLKRCVEIAILKITDNDSTVRESFLSLLCQLPLDITTSCLVGLEKGVHSHRSRLTHAIPSPEAVSNMHTVWLARRNFISRNPPNTFHSHNFRAIMAFILQGSSISDDRLIQMFHTCQRAEKTKADDRIYNCLTVNNKSLLWFWATWEAAQFCVLSKLRTPFGKPQETFTTIEAAIKSLLLEAKLLNCDDSEKSDAKLKEPDFEGPLQTHLRSKLLLDFIEHLEKLMYNAYEGCATAMPGAPKAVKTFFRTNKGTCLEWLTRIRMAVLLLALHMGSPSLAVRQGYQLLHDLKDMNATQGAEFEHGVMNVVHALIDLHCPEAILGLYVWCKEIIGRKFTWMKAAVEQASRRYETAAHEFVCLIRSHQGSGATKAGTKTPTRVSDAVSNTNGREPGEKLKHNGQNGHDSHDEPDLPILTFMSNQVIECYRRLNNWSDLMKWVESQHQVAHEQNGSIATQRFGTAVDWSYLSILSKFEDLEPGLLKTETLMLHDKPEETLHKLMVPFPQRMLQEADAAMMAAALKWDSSAKLSTDDQQKLCYLLNKASQRAGGPIRVAAMDWPPRLPSEHMALFQATSAMLSFLDKERKSAVLPLTTYLELDLLTADCGTWNQAIRWSKHMEFINRSSKDARIQAGILDGLQLTVARLARKHRNLKLAQKLLIQHVKRNMDIDWAVLQSSLEMRNSLITEVLKQLQTQEPNTTIMCIQKEGAKLLHSLSHGAQAVEVLVHTVSSSSDLINMGSSEQRNSASEMSARALLTLVKWVQADNKLYTSSLTNLICESMGAGRAASIPNLCKLQYLELHGSSDVESGEENCGDAIRSPVHVPVLVPLVPDTELLLGQLVQQSTVLCPSLAKGWANLASWLYKWGRKAVDVASEKSVDLLPEEWNRLMALLPKDTTEDEITAITGILSRIYSIPDADFYDTYGDGAEMTRRHLLSACPCLQSSGPFCIDGLIGVWKGVVDRIYSFYKLSAEAYFKCLMLSEIPSQENGEHCEDGNIIATLRLLRLVVKHASELRQILEEGLAHTPTGPWKGIIPQLFARLNHPESYVRQSISDLLCRVAHAAPHLIVFPAVVGSSAVRGELKDSTGRCSGVLGQYLSQASDDGLDDKTDDPSQDGDVSIALSAEEDQHKAVVMRNCFAAMVETLSKQDPRTISEVQTLVHELRRITLLWDEFWVGTLNQYHADFSRKITQLENEVKKVLHNASLSPEEKNLIIQKKHDTILKPTLFVLEQLHHITSQPPETPHEQWFQDTFGKMIEDVIKRLQSPDDPAQPQTSWQMFKQLLHTLQHRAQKRSSLILSMDQVSPVLTNLRSTVISMPGAQMRGGKMVTIESIDQSINILPTKTKPKKLVFHGSDGCKYVYLFKGLEDLHLDERIMQFISIINSMFVRNKRQGKVVYYARHYSVTPLGPRSGLIQWVDGATPLFGLYKRWQQREAVAQALKASSSSNMTTTLTGATLRPSEIYYNKLTPLLKEKGITNLDNRKDWPLSVMRQVLVELMEETPKDLLAKELWCSSSSAAEWWKITETYSQSTAVMSMIGYIIGLGDRHLDNVLVDLASGEVVHIDYNVCFEKGKNLRVPEKVPFRMTPNIETGLGVTGVEGIFRVSCEHVIKTMRRGRETLLTLLEAFVYDPLIDWTPGGEGGFTGAVYGGGQLVAMEARQSKLDMEQDITYSMFSIRITEMKADWVKNRDELLTSLPRLEDELATWLAAQSQLLSAEESLQDHHQQMAYLKEAEANPNHMLYALHQRYAEYAVVKNSLNSAKEAAQDKLNECERWHNLHKVAVQGVTGSELARWFGEAAKPFDFAAPSFAPVIDFLHTAGQSQLLTQCEQADSEVGNLLHQHQTILRACLDTLTTYATIAVQYPPSYLEQNRSFKWQHWLLGLMCNFTLNECQEVITKFHAEYGLDGMDLSTVQSVIGVEYQLQTLINDTNTSLLKLYDRMRLEGLENAAGLNANTEDSRTSIQQFVKDNGVSGQSSITCVLLTALCSLNKRCLMMECAAFAAGDRLVDLTSRDGDWFLDEVNSISNNIMELLLLLRSHCQVSDPDVNKAMDSVTAVHHVVASLQDLHLNFLTIILPEALKHIQASEASVVQALQLLASLVAQVGCPLDALVSQLEMYMRSVVMEMEAPNLDAINLVNLLKANFNSFVKAPSTENAGGLSPGQMLFMGFNGLFTKLDQDFSDALSTMASLVLPQCWKKVDLIKDAKALLAPVSHEAALAILGDIFFVKRLQAMQDFFSLAQQHSHALLSILKDKSDPLSLGAVYSDDHLTRPIKRFIAEFVNKQMLGLLSQNLCHIICLYVRNCAVDVTAEIELRDIGAESKVALEELCRKAVDLGLKEDCFKAGQLSQASGLASAYEAAWKKQDIARRLEQNILALKTSLQRIQLQLAGHQWLHEDILIHGPMGGLHSLATPTRATVMSEMRKSMQALLGLEASLVVARDRYLNLVSSVEQRLKWAVGANPTVTNILEDFGQSVAARNELIACMTKVGSEVTTTCSTILHLEALRTRTSEAVSSDNVFLQLINRCQESCLLAESCKTHVTALEEKLMELKPIDGQPITKEWIAKVTALVTDATNEIQGQLTDKKMVVYCCWDTIKNQVMIIRSQLATHHRLMTDIRAILKSMAKYEEQECGCPVMGVKRYMQMYKGFSETFSNFIREVLTEELTLEKVRGFAAIVHELCADTHCIYEEVLQFAVPLTMQMPLPTVTTVDCGGKGSSQDGNNGKREESVRSNSVKMAYSPRKHLTIGGRSELFSGTSPASQSAVRSSGPVKKATVIRDPRTGKILQERNSNAVNIWRRVKMKLDGRDPDSSRRSTVSEQVAFVIEEATNLDNLAVLYEGWTPWV